MAFRRCALAVEPAEEFVKGLQERGLHELALEYLDGLKSSPLADEATRKQIPYLRGVALIEQSRQSTDPAARNKLLDEARKELEQFAEANPESVQGAEAQIAIGDRANDRAAKSWSPKPASFPRRTPTMRSGKTWGATRGCNSPKRAICTSGPKSAFSKELEKLPPTTSTEARDDTGSRRQELRARWRSCDSLRPQTQFEAAQSYPPEADEFRKLNETAAAGAVGRLR